MSPIHQKKIKEEGNHCYNTSFGTSFMKQHVEAKHFELFNEHVGKFVDVEDNEGHNQKMLRDVTRLCSLPRNVKK